MNRCFFCSSQTTTINSNYDECGVCDVWISKVPAKSYDDTYYYTSEFRTSGSLYRAKLLFNYFKPELVKKKGLDFGCNDGAFVITANDNRSSFVGVDINESVLNISKKMSEGSFFYSDEIKSKFSVVTAFDIIEHFENIEDFFSTVDSWLEKGGNLVITTPNKNSKWIKIFNQGWHGFAIPEYHRYVFSLSFLETQLIKHGFSMRRSFTVSPICKNGWKLLIASGYRLKRNKLQKTLSLPSVLFSYLYGKTLVRGEEDTLCIIAQKN